MQYRYNTIYINLGAHARDGTHMSWLSTSGCNVSLLVLLTCVSSIKNASQEKKMKILLVDLLVPCMVVYGSYATIQGGCPIKASWGHTFNQTIMASMAFLW